MLRHCLEQLVFKTQSPSLRWSAICIDNVSSIVPLEVFDVARVNEDSGVSAVAAEDCFPAGNGDAAVRRGRGRINAAEDP